MVRLWKIYRAICTRGVSALKLITKDSEYLKSHPWLYGEGYPPSLNAGGRYRFLTTLAMAKQLPGRRILEIGTDGLLCSCLVDGENYVALNSPSARPRELENWREGNSVDFLEGHYMSLPTDQKFDLIVASEVIHDTVDGDRFFDKLLELLSENGQILFTTPNGKNWRAKENSFYTYRGLENTLQQKGYKNIRVEPLISPWISGEGGFRFLPKTPSLLPAYYWIDQSMQKALPRFLRQRFTNQLIATARR